MISKSCFLPPISYENEMTFLESVTAQTTKLKFGSMILMLLFSMATFMQYASLFSAASKHLELGPLASKVFIDTPDFGLKGEIQYSRLSATRS